MKNISTIGVKVEDGYQHECHVCGMNRVVRGQRFVHICGESNGWQGTSLPTFKRVAMNFGGAVFRAVGSALSGGTLLRPKNRAAKALKICKACPSGMYTADKRCAACGCSVELKVKLATEQCPRGHW